MRRSFRTPSALPPVLLLSGFLLTAFPARGQAEQDPTFETAERVTAIDLLVEVRRRNEEQPPQDPLALTPADFELLWDGEAVPVIGVSSAPEPWQLTVYFAPGLSSPRALHWAAGALATQIGRLTALGTVEIVVADPEPRRLVPPGRDVDLLATSLADTSLFPDAVHNVLRLRGEYLAALGAARTRRAGQPGQAYGEETVAADAPSPEADVPDAGPDVEAPDALTPEELTAAALAAERQLIRQYQDGLLAWLTARESAPRRALLLVGGGFDLDPAAFYRASLGGEVPGEAGGPDARQAQEELAATLAAYGWLTHALEPADDQTVLRTGVTLGKWRLSKEGIVYEEDRDPEKGEALVELARSLRREGDFEQAEQALDQALHAFHGDKRTAALQGEAYLLQAEVQQLLGKYGLAQSSFAKAAEVAPRIAGDRRAALFDQPLEPLERLVEQTSGRLLRRDADLTAALDSLDRRLRLTYQIAGPPDGHLHKLGLTLQRDPWEAHAPAWARSATPETVAALRARALLAAEVPAGESAEDLAVTTDFQPAETTQAGGQIRGTLDVRVTLPRRALPRLTLGTAAGDAAETGADVRHQFLESEAAAAGEEGDERTFAYRGEITLPADQPWVAIVVEDLETGRWTGELLEVPER